jgi:ribosomal protein S18 acetylase RimI-like enzyme
MIRLASTKDIESIMNLTQACAQHMIAQGIFQWNAHYPPRKAFEKDLNRQELYVLELEKAIKGCIVLSTLKDAEYQPIQWLSKTENNLYIHRLAIHPEVQGQGYAQGLMSFAENYAREQQFESVRLDTFSQNKRNQRFYEQRGYQRLGNIYFPKQSTAPFYCYELLL